MSGQPVSGGGFHGKIPSRGDFVSWNLPGAFIDPWDSWLGSVLHAAREALGGAWDDTYLTSPSWRFAVTAPLCGPQGWTGIVMPSVDRVGRYFPLSIAVPMSPDVVPFDLVTGWDRGYAQADALAGSLLHDEIDLRDFGGAVADLAAAVPLPAPAATRPAQGEAPGRIAGWQVPLGDDMVETLAQMLHVLASDGLGVYSLWWTSGGVGLPSAMALCRGLPPPAAGVALFDGRWDDRGWRAHHRGGLAVWPQGGQGDPV